MCTVGKSEEIVLEVSFVFLWMSNHGVGRFQRENELEKQEKYDEWVVPFLEKS